MEILLFHRVSIHEYNHREQSGAEIVTENHPLPKGDAEQVESSALSSLAIFVAVVVRIMIAFFFGFLYEACNSSNLECPFWALAL